MPSRAYWVEEPWLMSADYEGALTLEDFESVMSTCLAQVRQQQVYFIVDITNTISVPMRAALLPSLLELVHHPNTAGFAWIRANRFARVTIPTFIRKPYRFCQTRDEALLYLKSLHDEQTTVRLDKVSTEQ